MKFQPKTEEELEAEMIVPDGEYDFTVMEAEERQSKKGNSMIQVKLNVFTEQGDLHLYDYLLEAMAFKLRHFCSSIGVLADYNLGTLEVSDIVGRSGKVKLTSKKEEGYPLKNVVKDYVKKENGEPPPVGSSPPNPKDDDLPF